MFLNKAPHFFMSFLYGNLSGFCDLAAIMPKLDLEDIQERKVSTKQSYLITYSLRCLVSKEKAMQGSATLDSALSGAELLEALAEAVEALKEWEAGDLTDGSSGSDTEDVDDQEEKVLQNE